MKNLSDGMPNGYQESIQKGLSAARYFGRYMSFGAYSEEEGISGLRKEIETADAIVIDAGSSLHAMQNDRQHFSLLISDMRKTSLILVICHLLWPKYTDILRMCKYNGITTDLLG